MGCAEILAFLSEFPEYNDRFDALFLMAPPLFMRNSRSRILTGIANLAEDVWGYYEIRRPKPRHGIKFEILLVFVIHSENR